MVPDSPVFVSSVHARNNVQNLIILFSGIEDNIFYKINTHKLNVDPFMNQY